MAAEVEPPQVWAVAGSYFEACNCEAICPCRRVGERAGGRSVYGICQFALSWQISQGIELSHVPRRWSIRADSYLTVRAETLVEAPAPVACGIPCFDQPGQEVVAGTFRVEDAPLSWELHGQCGFATGFAYSSFQHVSPRINDGNTT